MSTQNYFAKIISGIAQNVATALSGGSGDANKIPQLDANGQLTTAMMPTGVSADVFTGVVSGSLSAGSLVAIIAGSKPVVAADNSNSRPAWGYVTSAYTDGQTATVYKYGTISGLTGLTLGGFGGAGLCFLGTVGAITQTPVATGSGLVSQVIGAASSATTVEFDPQQYYIA